MVNKLWYNPDPKFEGEIVEGLIALRKYIQELIDLYCPELFKTIEDITPDNLQQFLNIILKHFQYYHLNDSNIMDIGEAFSYYFSRAYGEEFPETCYPSYPKDDRRTLVLTILENCMEYSVWIILPEDVPFLLECLNISDELIIYMEGKLNAYFNQFDLVKRCNVEIPRRWEVITRQRKEALEKGEPLPIRPMGIELDMCYKDK